MASTDADIIVVGAGPAGSAAAIMAARGGRRVLLLDRATFPRDKPCGDLVGARALRSARRLGIDERDIQSFHRLGGALIVADGGEASMRPSTRAGQWVLGQSDARVIPRRVFDTAMMRAAVLAGAEFRQVTVRAVEPWDGVQRVVRGAGPSGPVCLTAKAVIVAGGYGCRVAREIAAGASNNSSERSRGIAMRAYFRNVSVPRDQIVFCLNDWVLPGYGWVFPLPNGDANVGVGTLIDGVAGRREHLHDLYERFVQHPDSPAARWLEDATPVGPARSWPLDLGPRRRRLMADGLLVAGESAALVGPLTGAGITFALESGARAGAVAAAAVARGDSHASALAPYERWVRRHHIPWLWSEAAAQRFLSDPTRLRRLLTVVRPLPPTPTLGGRLLLHLG